MYSSTAVSIVRRRAVAGRFALSVVFVLMAASVASALRPADAAKQRPMTRVHGTWSDPVGSCTTHITKFDPATGVFSCTGTTVYTGTWVGSSTWTFTGHRDPTTGGFTGQTRELFTGRARHRHGTLTFVEQVTEDAAGKEDNRSQIVRATGGLAGSRGHVRSIGQSNKDGSASGTYSGRWRLGK